MDNIEFSGDLPLIGRVTVKAGLRPGSPLTLTVTTVALVWAGCSCAVTSFALGLPGWAAAGTIVLPTLIHLVCSHRRTGR
jgi:hypothetical protein